ncbi:YolD-like family protein [Evansella tamaricis]|uniref:YolD-like family protein n=1 Tax=Evansella tamaricis TaxID=2069301 RepID=A0ABS6JM30_9BACI|nr:YolD-like family protein [Evansella tamaricis]MBU9714737.1 YolD-like family protein [Evansella tamaricis]
MTNRDRGVIKWTSMMLPEHVQMLKKLSEEHQKIKPPEIDGQVLEEWSRTLAEAYQGESPLLITTVTAGRTETFRGFVRKLDQMERQLWLECPITSRRFRIPFQEIVDIYIDTANEQESL